MKNGNHNTLEPKMTSTNVLFCPTNSLKPNNIKFIVMSNQEKEEILISEYVNCQIFVIFAYKTTSKKLQINFLLID